MASIDGGGVPEERTRASTLLITGDDQLQGRNGSSSLNEVTVIETILISGLLTEERLHRALQELRNIAETSADLEVVFLIDSPGGGISCTLEFLDAVLREDGLCRLAERAMVKIYEAHSSAAYLAFSLGATHELAAQASVGFHLGKIQVQTGNPEQLLPDGRVSPKIMETWRRYQSAVFRLAKRLGLDDNPNLTGKLAASGRVELTAEECLRRGIVNRLF